MPEWLQAVLIGSGLLGLVGLLWHTHEKHDEKRDKDSKERDEALWDQVGRDSHSGMRKTTHDAYNMGLANKGLIERLEEQVKDLARKVFDGNK